MRATSPTPDPSAVRSGIGILKWEAVAAVRLTTLGLTCACPKVSESERPFWADFGLEPRRRGRVSPKVRRVPRVDPPRTTLRGSRLCATAAGPRAPAGNRERVSEDGRMVEAAGIEPASQGRSVRASTHVVGLLVSPHGRRRTGSRAASPRMFLAGRARRRRLSGQPASVAPHVPQARTTRSVAASLGSQCHLRFGR